VRCTIELFSKKPPSTGYRGQQVACEDWLFVHGRSVFELNQGSGHMRWDNENMMEAINVVNVGAPDPELKNSPILDRESEEFEMLDLELESGVCYFNAIAYRDGEYVCSGNELLHCERGVWIRKGSCYSG
jgi:hypothetical protein